MIETESHLSHTTLSQVKLERARGIVQRYTPFCLPRQRTIIGLKPLPPQSIAEYPGPLRNRHYFFINENRQGRSELEDILTISHELVHQWHAELMGPSLWWTIDPDYHVSDEEFKTQPVTKLFEKLNRIIGNEIPSVTDAISEGLSVLTELFTFDSYFRAYGSHDSPLGRELRRLRNGYFADLAYDGPDQSPHREGFNLIWQVFRRGGFEGVIAFIKQVDYALCNQIMKGTKQYSASVRSSGNIPLIANRYKGWFRHTTRR